MEKADDKVVERVEIQGVKKVEEKVVKRVGHKAETSINENAGQKLKEVELEETPKVEQSPYDKLSFPGRFITKAQNKVISKFRTYMSDAGVKLPEITNMHDAYVQMMFIKYILSNREEVAELPDISTSKIDPPVLPKYFLNLKTKGSSHNLAEFALDVVLVDSRATVNVVSLEMVKSLRIKNKETNTSSLMILGIFLLQFQMVSSRISFEDWGMHHSHRPHCF